jgi:hypothetical protein
MAALAGAGGAALDAAIQQLQAGLHQVQQVQQQQLAVLQQVQATQQQLQGGQQQLQATLQHMQQQFQAPVALMRAIDNARRRNHHALDGVAYMVVPMDGGGPPPNWPAGGMTRAWLRSHAIAAVDALLGDYGQPAAGTAFERRDRLAEHIGTVGL